MPRLTQKEEPTPAELFLNATHVMHGVCTPQLKKKKSLTMFFKNNSLLQPVPVPPFLLAGEAA